MCYNNLPSIVASLFSWRCLAASTSSFFHAAINLRPPSVTILTHTSAFNAIAFQSPVLPNAQMSIWTQSVHCSFSFQPRHLRTAPSRFSNSICFGSRPSLIRRSVPAHKRFLVRATVNILSMFSHRVISRARLQEASIGPQSYPFFFFVCVSPKADGPQRDRLMPIASVAGTFNMPTSYRQWVWKREAFINWSMATCQGSTRSELP